MKPLLRRVLAGTTIGGAILLGGAAQSQSPSAIAGDAAAGEQVFRRCAACHATEPGQRRAGPHLQGIVGRKAASAEGFAYSPALQNSGLTWTPEQLDAFLTAPQKLVPGTRQTMAVANPTERQNLIAYLATLGR